MGITILYHLRHFTSTPFVPVTMCGETPWRESHSTTLMMTEWEWVKTMPRMPSLCQQCVEKQTGGMQAVVTTAEVMEEIKETLEKDDGFEIPF